jgi:hypothetical protein
MNEHDPKSYREASQPHVDAAAANAALNLFNSNMKSGIYISNAAEPSI